MLFFSPSHTHGSTPTQIPTSILSLQDFLEVFEGARLFGFRDGLHVVLQHLVDVGLCVKTITAHGGGDGRLWAEGDKRAGYGITTTECD